MKANGREWLAGSSICSDCASSVAQWILSNRLRLCFVFQLWWHRPSIFPHKHRPGQLRSLRPAADAGLSVHAMAGQRTNQHGSQRGTHLRPDTDTTETQGFSPHPTPPLPTELQQKPCGLQNLHNSVSTCFGFLSLSRWTERCRLNSWPAESMQADTHKEVCLCGRDGLL